MVTINYNDDNVMLVSNDLWWIILITWVLRVLGYKRGSDIKVVKVYLISVWLGEYQRTNTIKKPMLRISFNVSPLSVKS